MCIRDRNIGLSSSFNNDSTTDHILHPHPPHHKGSGLLSVNNISATANFSTSDELAQGIGSHHPLQYVNNHQSNERHSIKENHDDDPFEYDLPQIPPPPPPQTTMTPASLIQFQQLVQMYLTLQARFNQRMLETSLEMKAFGQTLDRYSRHSGMVNYSRLSQILHHNNHHHQVGESIKREQQLLHNSPPPIAMLQPFRRSRLDDKEDDTMFFLKREHNQFIGFCRRFPPSTFIWYQESNKPKNELPRLSRLPSCLLFQFFPVLTLSTQVHL
eukprot:TRINITY_DN9262_c0_g1_i5.p1 TRINITY_DN9262_c0_g1~~TRINITY_DN9262_c0_g1_i5.p1  ORF type:complete len:291 (-),score=28.07 TRINITY_DN9262_c0_g1_i5:41-853(-)